MFRWNCRFLDYHKNKLKLVTQWIKRENFNDVFKSESEWWIYDIKMNANVKEKNEKQDCFVKLD